MDINWMLVLPLLVLQLILVIVAIVDLLKQDQISQQKKIIWIFVILFINLIGPILYFIFGRRNQ